MKKGKVVIDFYADGCGNCKMIEGILKQLEGEYKEKGVTFEKVNIKDAQDLVEQYSVAALPTLVFLNDGVFKDKLVGLKPKTLIVKKLEEVYS